MTLYAMTRAHLQKAGDIQSDPREALVMSIARRFAWILPSATIQIARRAELIDRPDEVGTGVFRGFWIGRRIARPANNGADKVKPGSAF